MMIKVDAVLRKEKYKIEIESPSGNKLIADEPLEKGGKDLGFSPKELLVAALSACTSATLRMYIDHKGWEIAEIKVHTELTEKDDTYTFSRIIHIGGTATEEQKNKLMMVANKCPIHKVLAGSKEFKTQVL